MILPEDFIQKTKPLLGDQWVSFTEALNEVSPTSIRFNKQKYSKLPEMESVPWCENGFYLPQRPSFTFDPLFHTGAYYVQEASSMFVGQFFKQYVKDQTVRVLDL